MGGWGEGGAYCCQCGRHGGCDSDGKWPAVDDVRQSCVVRLNKLWHDDCHGEHDNDKLVHHGGLERGRGVRTRHCASDSLSVAKTMRSVSQWRRLNGGGWQDAQMVAVP